MTIKEEKYLDKLVESALDIGEKRTSKIQEHQRLLELYGLTGLRIKHFLNSLLSNGKLTFLQLGVYRGAALACALYNNPEVTAYAVDDWHFSPLDSPASKVGADGKFIPWPNVKLAAEDNIAKFAKGKVKLISKSWNDLKATDVPEAVEIIHLQPNSGASKEEIKTYLSTVLNFAAKSFVLIIDYHKLDDVSNSVKEWISENKLTLVSVRTKDSRNLADVEGWWGGIGCYVLSKQVAAK